MAYLIDTDVLIRARNLHYGFDLCPGFWDYQRASRPPSRRKARAQLARMVKSGPDKIRVDVKPLGPRNRSLD